MDKVRFGRALGSGAREAGKALLRAADAAAAPDPNEARRRGQAAGASVGQRVAEVRAGSAGVRRGGRRFGEAVWKPAARLSGVLWLEFTGVFFGLFALTAAIEVWKQHRAMLAGGEQAHRGWYAVAMLVIFGYFTVSSFVRASRRARRR